MLIITLSITCIIQELPAVPRKRIVTVYTLSIYPSVHKQLIRTLFDAHIAVAKRQKSQFRVWNLMRVMLLRLSSGPICFFFCDSRTFFLGLNHFHGSRGTPAKQQSTLHTQNSVFFYNLFLLPSPTKLPRFYLSRPAKWYN